MTRIPKHRAALLYAAEQLAKVRPVFVGVDGTPSYAYADGWRDAIMELKKMAEEDESDE